MRQGWNKAFSWSLGKGSPGARRLRFPPGLVLRSAGRHRDLGRASRTESQPCAGPGSPRSISNRGTVRRGWSRQRLAADQGARQPAPCGDGNLLPRLRRGRCPCQGIPRDLSLERCSRGSPFLVASRGVTAGQPHAGFACT